jgi:hypothetical protein
VEINEFLRRFQGVRESGTGHQALCPAHNDRNPSLSIKEGDGGRIVLHCHKGCSPEDVVKAIGLKMSDLFPSADDKRHKSNGKPQTPLGRVVAHYDYRDEDGYLLYQVTRHRPKDFRQRRPVGKNGWAWNL